MKNEMNLTMLTDFYEFTMMNGFFAEGYKDKIAYFDMFFRRVPEDGGFAIMAGVEQIIEYIKEINFTVEDIEYLGVKEFLKRNFLNIWRILSLNVTYGQCLTVHRYFRASRLLR